MKIYVLGSFVLNVNYLQSEKNLPIFHYGVNKSMVLCTYCIHVSARPPKLDALVGLSLRGRGKVLLVLLLQVGILKTCSLFSCSLALLL